MKRPTEAQAARIEAKIERLRADATKEFFAGRYDRNRSLSSQADALEREYHAACGVFGADAAVEMVKAAGVALRAAGAELWPRLYGSEDVS